MSMRSYEDSIWHDQNGPVVSAVGLIAQLCGDIARSTKIAAGHAPARTQPTGGAAVRELPHAIRRAA